MLGPDRLSRTARTKGVLTDFQTWEGVLKEVDKWQLYLRGLEITPTALFCCVFSRVSLPKDHIISYLGGG